MQPSSNSTSVSVSLGAANPPVWNAAGRSWFMDFLLNPFKDIDARARWRKDALQALKSSNGSIKSAGRR